MPNNNQLDRPGSPDSNFEDYKKDASSPQPDNSDSRPKGARGTAAMDPGTRQEVARKGGLAVSRNKQHMAEIGRKGGQSVSKNREHMAKIGRKGGAASRGGHGPLESGESHVSEGTGGSPVTPGSGSNDLGGGGNTSGSI